MPDKVVIYEDHVGQFRWKRYDTGNNETLSESSESYVDKGYAEKVARELNPDIEIEVFE